MTYFKSQNTGKPVIFIHGLLDASYGFRKIVPLIKEEYQIFLFDIPGFGKSPMPKIKYLYQLDIFADLIYEAILNLGLKNITLIGHSMGGLISQHIALKDKLQKNNIVKKLILISSGGTPHKKRDEMKEILFPENRPQLQRLLRHLYYEKFPEPNIFIQNILIHAWNSTEYKYLTENTIKREKEIFFGNKIGEAKIPTLILSGLQDEITTPKMMNTLANYIKGSKLKLIPYAKHAIHLEKPECIAKEINAFLN
ncbi:MAG: alpha/beta hydrolase [Leptospiraceae bacterium]|nr:alpha/beta hydrolase [Leptospiraceae bacterium]